MTESARASGENCSVLKVINNSTNNNTDWLSKAAGFHFWLGEKFEILFMVLGAQILL